MAMQRGLSCAIVNPGSKELMDAYYSFRALNGLDNSCEDFINYSLKSLNNNVSSVTKTEYTLNEIIEKGLISLAKEKTIYSLNNTNALDIINLEIIPALNRVGELFEHEQTSLIFCFLFQTACQISRRKLNPLLRSGLSPVV